MYSQVINFISSTETTDRTGDSVITEVKREVYADLKSIGQSEFYQAQAHGLKPEIKFIIADYYDYNDEKIIEYDEKRYSILRTFRVDKTLEIVCQGDIHGNA